MTMRTRLCMLIIGVSVLGAGGLAFAADQPNPGNRTITDRNKSQRLGNEVFDPYNPYGRWSNPGTDRNRTGVDRDEPRRPDMRLDQRRN